MCRVLIGEKAGKTLPYVGLRIWECVYKEMNLICTQERVGVQCTDQERKNIPEQHMHSHRYEKDWQYAKHFIESV
jgi:hypothetical protein